MLQRVLFALPLTALLLVAPLPAVGQDDPKNINDLIEKRIKEAVRKVAPSVVQIVTLGGSDRVVTGPKGPAFRKAMGPTTGLIVSEDGYVISSAFNFVNNPTTIQITVQGHKNPYVAKRIATDRTRMVTLLKIDAKGLTAPTTAPKKDIAVGHWSIALGRTLKSAREVGMPSVSLGVISALNRVWGRALQTDANTSPVNYGGPLIDIQGRVQGLIIPASPRGEGETVGFEWYDSGIGFAVPMEDVERVLPKLKKGQSLNKGVFGIRLSSPDIYGATPKISGVEKDSAADRAGLKSGDVIVELDGHPIVRIAQIKHVLGPKYEGDVISIKYKRADKVHSVKAVELGGTLTSTTLPYLGILPLRDDPKLGVAVRHVYEKSAADHAGIKTGDRIMKYGEEKGPMRGFTGKKPSRDELADFLSRSTVGAAIRLELDRKGKSETVTAKLDAFPGTSKGAQDSVPLKLPEAATLKQALTPLKTANAKIKPPAVPKFPKDADKELLNFNTGGHKYWAYVPDNYDPNVTHSLVVWFHPPGKNSDKDAQNFADAWAEMCSKHHIILLGPITDNETGWIPSESDWVRDAIRETMNRYHIDDNRVVAHGLGVGGQMAVHMGFAARDLIRGVATVGAVATRLKNRQTIPNQRLQFYFVAGDRDPLIKAIREGVDQLTAKNFPVMYRELENRAREYLPALVLEEMARWVDSLDRQ